MKSAVLSAVVLILLGSACHSPRVDTTIAQMKAEQAPLPIDSRERLADDSDVAAARKVLADAGNGREVLWIALQRSANQAVRAHLIEMLASSGITARSIAQRLRITSDGGERAALIRALGQFQDEQISPRDREALVTTLLESYQNDPDAEVHSSIRWLLTNAESDSTHRRLDWSQVPAIDALDSALQQVKATGRGWREIVMGHTMIAIHPASPFMMGAPLTEARSEANELPHEVRIPRAFAIASKEVSVAQFQQFLNETGRRERWLKATRNRWPRDPDPEKFFAYPTRPQFAVTWYEAAEYCNWLSAKAGIPKDQWVYPDSIGPGMVLPADYLHRTGFRLPTEAEWEYAAQGGKGTQKYYWGEELTPGGRWVANIYQGDFPEQNSGEDGFIGVAPVKSFPGNGYGLYDLEGNVWEWCADFYRPDYYAHSPAKDPRGPKNSFDPNEPGVVKRVQRGGSFLCSDRYCERYRIAGRGKGEHTSAASHIGFRCVMDPNSTKAK